MNRPHPVQALVLQCLTALTALFSCAAAAAETKDWAAYQSPEYIESELALGQILAPFKGDLPEIRKRGVVRILVPLERPDFYLAGPTLQGFDYDLGYQYEVYLSKQRQPGGAPLTVVFVPVRRSELLPALLDGRGDIAAGGLKITAERRKQAAFAPPYLPDLREVIVTHDGEGDLPRGFEDLADQPVHVPQDSLRAAHLRQLNRLLQAETGRELKIETLPADLTTEELLRRVATGKIRWAVADHYAAMGWTHALPGLRVLDHLRVRQGLETAWAVRPENPELLENLSSFMEKARKGTLIGNVLIKRYFEEAEWLTTPPALEETARLRQVAELLRKEAPEFGFDWLAVVAQAYQESRLDQDRVSHANARGLLQVRPSTAELPEVGIPDIHRPENNVRAGLKYLRYLLDNHFPAKWVKPESRFFFALAGYNAGPTKIGRIRKLTSQNGHDPQRWFGQTEATAQEVIGNETVQYVGYILRYYLAYRAAMEMDPGFRELLWAAERERVHAVQMGRAMRFTQGLLILLCLGGLLAILAHWRRNWRRRGPVAG